MYSLVLMSAFSTSPNAPEFNGYFRDLFSRNNCAGCAGCSGGAARYSCSGGCSGTAYACSGCCGGGFLGLRDRISTWWNANGCCGGYACSGSYSCFGSAAFSCFGGQAMSYTPVMNGGYSCFGGPVPSAPAPDFGPYPPAGPSPTIPFADPSPAPPMVVPERSGLRPAGFASPTTTVGASAAGHRASVVVRLPADAKLFVDGAPLRQTGSERKFQTPALPAGMEYTYRFTAEYERNGEAISVGKNVVVRAGGSVAVEFADLSAAKVAPGGADVPPAKLGSEAVAAAPVSLPKIPPLPEAPATTAATAPATPAPTAPVRATITVKLPAGATLYVDDRKSPSTEPVRQFHTPPLPAGRDFSYLLRAEIVRNGQPERMTQKVTFRAGEQVSVDFSNFDAGR